MTGPADTTPLVQVIDGARLLEAARSILVSESHGKGVHEPEVGRDLADDPLCILVLRLAVPARVGVEVRDTQGGRGAQVPEREFSLTDLIRAEGLLEFHGHVSFDGGCGRTTGAGHAAVLPGRSGDRPGDIFTPGSDGAS